MPHNQQKIETSMSFQEILEMLRRQQEEKSAEVREAPASQIKAKRLSREVVLKVIEGLKQA